MAKKKSIRLVKKSKPRENEELKELPRQDSEDVCLYETDTDLLKSLDDPERFHFGLSKLKAKFITEIQDWSQRNGLKADVRVYFTIKEE